jgi:hypothetical protein
MAEFLNPFSGLQPGRALTKRELTRALRQALAAEEEAVHLYEALADAADDEVARAVLQDVADSVLLQMWRRRARPTCDSWWRNRSAHGLVFPSERRFP